jgi:hypothetical protein
MLDGAVPQMMFHVLVVGDALEAEQAAATMLPPTLKPGAISHRP